MLRQPWCDWGRYTSRANWGGGVVPQDDPNAQNKLEDPVKAPPAKEDEPLNIQNSLTPKHENNKMAAEENSSDVNSSDVNSLQNNMM